MKKNKNSRKSTKTLKKSLFEAASHAHRKAYAPYSRFKVGAALVDDQGNIHIGCNVENASYGATVCAERSAVSAMISQGGRRIKALVIVTDRGTPPCGICRQVLSEFALANAPILIANQKGFSGTYSIQELLPESFGPRHLDEP